MTSKLKDAEERLENALSRLDSAIRNSTVEANGEGRLAALESENRALRAKHGEIAGRLDQAIERLQKVLGAK